MEINIEKNKNEIIVTIVLEKYSPKFIKLEKKTVDIPNTSVITSNNDVTNSLAVSKVQTRKRRKTIKE